jgi:hypothetical protein
MGERLPRWRRKTAPGAIPASLVAAIGQQSCRPGDCPPHRGSGMLAAADQGTGLGPRGLCILAQAASPDGQDHGWDTNDMLDVRAGGERAVRIPAMTTGGLGEVIIRAGGSYDGRRGMPPAAGVSSRSAGGRALCVYLVMIPPRTRGVPASTGTSPPLTPSAARPRRGAARACGDHSCAQSAAAVVVRPADASEPGPGQRSRARLHRRRQRAVFARSGG